MVAGIEAKAEQAALLTITDHDQAPRSADANSGDAGWVELGRGTIRVADPAALRALAEER